ncbi:hypothetical protein [Xenorhabdus bovienii]|uniref:hypothetical protein n=1 Tax=Xenorhabdus bovienii TaxID=40576 RepID=UPI00237C5743|nr:hypothetical protein [Xenorhabdus bovienii]MDE1474128.1 hypothetical protein [Xenorhabdus bovienii]
MSNIQSQLNRGLSTAGKLTSSFKTFQRHHKKLTDSVNKIHTLFKKLNKAVENLKPIVSYAQETARMRADLKAYHQTIKQSLTVRHSAKGMVQLSAANQLASTIQTTWNVRQDNLYSKKNEFNLGVTGNMTNNFTLLDKLIININPKINILFSRLNKVKKVLKFPTNSIKITFQILIDAIKIFGSVGVKGLGLLGNAFGILGRTVMIVGRVMVANPILAIIGIIATAGLYIWKNWGTLGGKFSVLWDNIKNIFSIAWEGIKNLISIAWEGIKSYFMNGGLIGIIYQNWDAIKQSASEVWEAIKALLSEKWESIKQSVFATWENIKAQISGAWESVKQNTLEIWESVKKSISDKWDEIVNDVNSIPEKLKQAGIDMMENLLAGVKAQWDKVKSTFNSFTSWFTSWGKTDETKELKVKTSEEITKSETAEAAKKIAKYDKGGVIESGRMSLVGEYGPEIVRGSANVTSRKKTAQYAAVGLVVSSMSLPVAARDVPLHAQSLPAHTYAAVQAKKERSQPQQPREAPQYNIYVYGSEGQSAQDIARVVRQELEQRERMHQARMRSSLSDRGEDFS